MNEDWETGFTSPPHRSHLAAELRYRGNIVAEVYWLKGEFRCELYQPSKGEWQDVPALGFAERLTAAVEMLRVRLDVR